MFPQTGHFTTKNLFSSKQNIDLKTVNLASTTSGVQNKTVQLLTIINFIQDTMTKSQRAMKNTIRFQLDPAGQIINLTQKKIFGETFKLLNKNLNLVPTQNKINKKELHKEMTEFYRRIKLKAHFQDTRKQVNTDTFIEATKKDINEN